MLADKEAVTNIFVATGLSLRFVGSRKMYLTHRFCTDSVVPQDHLWRSLSA